MSSPPFACTSFQGENDDDEDHQPRGTHQPGEGEGSMKTPDRTGMRFHRLTVVSRMPKATLKESARWLCRCECGTEKIIPIKELIRKDKPIKSCGCLRRELIAKIGRTLNKTHGESYREITPEYQAWRSMLERCRNPKAKSFKHYGARGIAVCEHWSNFGNFLADMGRRPCRGYSLDRIDNNGGYEPDNCRWATIIEQNNNRRPAQRRTIT